MLKEPAVKITRAHLTDFSQVVTVDTTWIYGILFVNNGTDPDFPCNVRLIEPDKPGFGASAFVIRDVAISPLSSYEFEVPYLETRTLKIQMFGGEEIFVYFFHSNSGV